MKNFTLNRNRFDYRKLLASLALILMSTGFALAQNATNGGAIGNNQSVCPGEAPAPFISITPASGGNVSNAIEYLWMYGTSASFPGAGWQVAPGTNNQETYNPPAVGSTTFFIRCARRAGFTDFQAESNVVTVTALPSPFANINGVTNTNVFAGFTYNLNASYTANASSYAWDFNGDGFTDCFGQNCPFTYNTPGNYAITLTVTNNYGCTSTTSINITVAAPSGVNIMDPCFCGNPNNLFTPTAYYNNDYILINSNPGETWAFTNTGVTTVFNSNLAPIPNGTIIPETQPGVYFLNLWFNQAAGGWSGSASNGSFNLGTGPGPGVVCPPCANPLPVDLTYFEGNVEGASVVLKWETATETDNDYFVLEASTDGARFETIAEIEGAGTISTPQFYSFKDDNPVDGVNYYRLKQVDMDGDFEYFKTVSVEIEREATVFAVTPNPVRNIARIQLNENISSEAHLELVTMTGQTIKMVNVTSDQGVQEVMMNDLPSGVYYIRLVDRLSNEVLNQKIIKQ